MRFAALIFCLCLSTYISRMLPALFMDKVKLSKKASLFLQLIPYTAMAALVFPAILNVDDNMFMGLIAGTVAVLASLKNIPVIGVVTISVVSCMILYVCGFS